VVQQHIPSRKCHVAHVHMKPNELERRLHELRPPPDAKGVLTFRHEVRVTLVDCDSAGEGPKLM
jgi:hypothetical protein